MLLWLIIGLYAYFGALISSLYMTNGVSQKKMGHAVLSSKVHCIMHLAQYQDGLLVFYTINSFVLTDR